MKELQRMKEKMKKERGKEGSRREEQKGMKHRGKVKTKERKRGEHEEKRKKRKWRGRKNVQRES